MFQFGHQFGSFLNFGPECVPGRPHLVKHFFRNDFVFEQFGRAAQIILGELQFDSPCGQIHPLRQPIQPDTVVIDGIALLIDDGL